jgi:hypothetical protein
MYLLYKLLKDIVFYILMSIYTITINTCIITFHLYYFQKIYREYKKVKDDLEICLKEIESLHKNRMDVDETLMNIATTMKFTGSEWQQRFIEKKCEEVYKHHFGNEVQPTI